LERDLAVGRQAFDAREEHTVAAAAGIGGEIFDGAVWLVNADSSRAVAIAKSVPVSGNPALEPSRRTASWLFALNERIAARLGAEAAGIMTRVGGSIGVSELGLFGKGIAAEFPAKVIVVLELRDHTGDDGARVRAVRGRGIRGRVLR